MGSPSDYVNLFKQSVCFSNDVATRDERLSASHADKEDVAFAARAFGVASVGNEELFALPDDGVAGCGFNASDVAARVAEDHQVAFPQCVARQSVDQHAVALCEEWLQAVVGNGVNGGYTGSYNKHQRQQTQAVDNEQQALTSHESAARGGFFHGLVVHCQKSIVV